MTAKKLTLTIYGMSSAKKSLDRLGRAVINAFRGAIGECLSNRRALIEFSKMLDARTKETEQWQKRLKKAQARRCE